MWCERGGYRNSVSLGIEIDSWVLDLLNTGWFGISVSYIDSHKRDKRNALIFVVLGSPRRWDLQVWRRAGEKSGISPFSVISLVLNRNSNGTSWKDATVMCPSHVSSPFTNYGHHKPE
jgi:hypothetical protein